MHFKRTQILLPFLAGTALAQDCYTAGQEWKDVGTKDVVYEAFKTACSKANLAGVWNRETESRLTYCQNVASHSFVVELAHIDSPFGMLPTWYLSPGTCFDLLKGVYDKCTDRGGSRTLVAGNGDNNPWVQAKVRVDPENKCCNC
ncbi:hypothetical protein Daus18300_004658 [Diaporthe australafricana]|uniref:Uncharacterized protein n=1 Tax=Diaporthe australafricana TaxID=127596 RepID=A0ABR3X6V3_9PEZI